MFGGHYCSRKCGEEFEWRQTLSSLGKPYRKRHYDTEEGTENDNSNSFKRNADHKG